MTQKRKVVLWDLEGVLAIILEPSGVVYTNQTCGNSCLQSEAEGILTPFNNDYSLDNRKESIEYKLKNLLINQTSLSNDVADKLDKVFLESGFVTVKVDRNKLKESHEAWLFVEVEENDNLYFLKGFGNSKAVLTWQNSD